jgi:hypothetical protein
VENINASTAIAAYAISVVIIKTLVKKQLIEKEDVRALLDETLARMENSQLPGEPLDGARRLLDDTFKILSW